ncbi:hypothetical protein [Streptomyces humicola]|nr:hypothetical protein [Streptomyces humicola]
MKEARASGTMAGISGNLRVNLRVAGLLVEQQQALEVELLRGGGE